MAIAAKYSRSTGRMTVADRAGLAMDVAGALVADALELHIAAAEFEDPGLAMIEPDDGVEVLGHAFSFGLQCARKTGIRARSSTSDVTPPTNVSRRWL